MMRRIIYTIFFVSLLAAGASTATAQDTRAERRMLRSGNEQYKNERYTDAEIAYRRVLDMDSTSTMARYNIGNTLFSRNAPHRPCRVVGKLVQSGKFPLYAGKICRKRRGL